MSFGSFIHVRPGTFAGNIHLRGGYRNSHRGVIVLRDYRCVYAGNGKAGTMGETDGIRLTGNCQESDTWWGKRVRADVGRPARKIHPGTVMAMLTLSSLPLVSPAALHAAGVPAAAAKPNIVFVLVDDLGYGDANRCGPRSHRFGDRR